MSVALFDRHVALKAVLCALLVARSVAAADFGDADPRGFSHRGATAERELEQRFDSALSTADMRAWMERYTSAPNQVGSEHDKANAEFMLGQFRAWGWKASIETYSVLYPTPREELVELITPSHVVAKLREPVIEGDATSGQTVDVLPPYNIYAADGDVTAELVYVNQGMPDDYAELERQGINVEGRIVIARYGGGWRGLKPKLAYEHGAVGCLIYSDPLDDGYGAGDVYPKGGYRPADSVQRGSVQDLTLYSGDPLTPGVGATRGARRLAVKDAKTILRIPVLPISYADATPLLAALAGRVVPVTWRGGLPLTYHFGPGPAVVHLKVRSNWSRKSIYDVIATLRGSKEPDRWIIRGNHHDAWVFGAADPFSGHVAMMAEAKAIGALFKSGWRPRRTLVYASWDGEEPGLLGSTEWVETHATELKAKAALYVNSDVNSRGTLVVEGSHSLQRSVSEVAGAVADPEHGVSVLARALATRRVAAFEAGHPPQGDDDLLLGALGSGSDYTPFLQHLGIASLNVEFSGEADYGVYHSAYDSFDHFRRFVDPTFDYGRALAQVAGRIVLRASQAELLPACESDFAAAVAGYADEIHKLLEANAEKAVNLDKLLGSGAYELAQNAQLPRTPPVPHTITSGLNLAGLDRAVDRLKSSSKDFDAEYLRLAAADEPMDEAKLRRMNDALSGLETVLTAPQGLPGRQWYRHMLYAPGVHTGYGVKTLPGIREAIEESHWDEARQYVAVVAHALDAYSDRLAYATADGDRARPVSRARAGSSSRP